MHLDRGYIGEASATGLAFAGFDRDASATATVEAQEDVRRATVEFSIAQGDFDVQRVNGLPQETVTPSDPALLERIRRQAALKAAALPGRLAGDGFAQPFRRPWTDPSTLASARSES